MTQENDLSGSENNTLDERLKRQQEWTSHPGRKTLGMIFVPGYSTKETLAARRVAEDEDSRSRLTRFLPISILGDLSKIAMYGFIAYGVYHSLR